MNKKEQNTNQMRICIQPSLHKRLKKVCEQKYKTVSGVIKDLILVFVEENEEK
jgi:predicted DNA-binding protein